MSSTPQNHVSDAVSTATGITQKGLGAGTVGLLGAIVIGISCIAPAYTLTGALGPTVSEVGNQALAVIMLGFIPMFLVAFGYRELNAAMPDSGSSFTWASIAFGPRTGWMAGWGLIAATILVLSNLAGIAVEFFYLLIGQLAGGNSQISSLYENPFINVATCLVFIVIATFISYRDMQTTQKLQYVLVGFQILVMVGFGVMAFMRVTSGDAPVGSQPFDLSWFNPFEVAGDTTAIKFSAIAAGLSLSLFIFWGWDVILTMSEETKGSSSTPGKAATLTMVIIVSVYLFVSAASLSFAGMGTTGNGLGNPKMQENVFFFLADPVMGPLAALMSLAVLSSSFASLQSTVVGPARTMLAMGHYGALPKRFDSIHPKFFTPGFATVVSSVAAAVFYAVMRFVSNSVLWDTITALGAMICFYYGLTALAAVWYFRKTWFTSVRNFIFRLAMPLIGGVILGVLFFMTLKDSMDPNYGSGSQIAGVGLVFILTLGVILLGAVIMVVQNIKRPDFFNGKTLQKTFAQRGD